METGSLGRNYPSDVTLLGDVKSGLRDIRAALDGLLTRERRTSIAAARRKPIETATASWHAGVTQAIAANLGRTPIHPDEVGKVLAETIDRNAIVVSENLIGSFDSFRFGFRDDEQTYLGAGGASLGWGLGAAAGAKLGAPDRQVICSIGDGSLMYSAAGFWTLARYHIPVLVVVWNNHNYQTVRLAYHRYRGKMLATGKYQGMYLGNPDIDFVKLAGSQGVGGERVVAGSELRPALRRGLAATAEGRPYLVEVVIARIGGGAESTWFERFDLAASRKRRV
jgi:benzoylformate decarboxylase